MGIESIPVVVELEPGIPDADVSAGLCFIRRLMRTKKASEKE